jgi:hypothetical protein
VAARSVITVVVSAALLAAGAAAARSSAPPKPFAAFPGQLAGLAAAGSRAAVEVNPPGSGCYIRVIGFGRGAAARQIRAHPPGCDQGFAGSLGVWLGKKSVVTGVDAVPGNGLDESFQLFDAPVTAASLGRYGAEWGDNENDQGVYGCQIAVASGGGTIALASGPYLSPNGLSCARTASASTTIDFLDGSRPSLDVPGSWTVLATDGKQVLLAALAADGTRTGALSIAGLDGATGKPPAVPPAVVRSTLAAWLEPEGLVLGTRAGASVYPSRAGAPRSRSVAAPSRSRRAGSPTSRTGRCAFAGSQTARTAHW